MYRLHSRRNNLDAHHLIGVKSRLPDTVTSSSDESDECEEEESDEDQDPLLSVFAEAVKEYDLRVDPTDYDQSFDDVTTLKAISCISTADGSGQSCQRS